MKPVFFQNQKKFREWLNKNHDKKTELLVGFWKVGTGKPSMTWSQSVDEALCFGWIDGIRRSIDNESYSIRFTPRKPTSIWSAINIRKIDELIKLGLMKPEGLAAFSKRKESRSKIYAYEKAPAKLSADLEKKFKSNKTAWNFFILQAPSYKKTITHRIMSAKQESTRLTRLDKIIKASESKQRLR